MYVCMHIYIYVCVYVYSLYLYSTCIYILYNVQYLYIMYSVCIYTVHYVYSVCNVSISIVLQLEIQMHLPLCMYSDQILVQSQAFLVCPHFFQQELIMRPYHASFLLTKNGMLLLSKHDVSFSVTRLWFRGFSGDFGSKYCRHQNIKQQVDPKKNWTRNFIPWLVPNTMGFSGWPIESPMGFLSNGEYSSHPQLIKSRDFNGAARTCLFPVRESTWAPAPVGTVIWGNGQIIGKPIGKGDHVRC